VIQGTACLLCIEFVILCSHTQVSAVTQQHADKVDHQTSAFGSLTEIYQQLVTGRGVKYMIIDPAVYSGSIVKTKI